jgi:hypothetical protein
MHFPKCAGLALVIVAAAAACSGAEAPCQPPFPPPVQPVLPFNMIYPSPGATDVPDNLSGVEFAGYPPTHTSFRLTAGAQTVALATLAPVPTPTPTPEDALPQWVAGLSTTLSADTTYAVKYTVSTSYSGNNCSTVHNTNTVTAGSFTTH